MRPDDLIKPISADAPCGEDLLLADDPDFVDYYFAVEDRFPTSYFNLARGTLFDPRSIDAKAEAAQIEALLKRSRDLRLLGIEAKFQVLSGRFKGFCDAVMGMAGLLEAFPDAVHPQDPQDRRNAVEELNALATVVAPLEYVTLFNDKRVGDVTFRPYATGSGKIPTREGEEPGNAGNITSALSSAENAKTVDGLYQQLTGLQAALKTITRVCQSGAGGQPPKFDRLDARLADLLDMVLGARPDLAGGGGGAASGDTGTESSPQGGAGGTSFVVQATPADVPDHKAAFRLLQAVEKYFVTTEPASLALLLVVQARLLVGRPLVDALDALMESNSGYAKINFGGEAGFSISMSRMRDLSSQANIPTAESWAEDEANTATNDDDTDADEVTAEDGGALDADGESETAELASAAAQPAAKHFAILGRDHAGMVLKQVEDFYQIKEPASPIPLLLFKARNMLAKDFHALARELLPPESY